MSIGARVKQARILKGFSLRALAEQVGVSAQAISKYERDLDTPGSSVLIRIAKALDVKLDYFYRTVQVEVTAGSYRKKSTMTQKQEDAVKVEIREWLERYLEIEQILESDPTAFSIPPVVNRQIEHPEDAERVAEELRKAWELGMDPVPNLTEMLEDKGIKVGFIEGNEKFDGYNFEAVNIGPIIVVKKNTPGDRQRFNLAHELGHVVLQHDETVDAELAAHRFAGAFLVPAAVVRRELGQKRTDLDALELHLLKQKYGLSMQGFVRRALDVGVISSSVYQELCKRFARNGWRKQEPFDALPPEKPRRMERMILRAWSEKIITEQRASELLGKSLAEYRREAAEDHHGACD